jgi:hypothetical protein
MDVEDRGQNLEVGSQRSENRDSLVGAAFQPRSYDFNDSNEFNDLPLTGIGMQDEVSDSLFLFPDT